MEKKPEDQREFIDNLRDAFKNQGIPVPMGDNKDISLNEYQDHILEHYFGLEKENNLIELNELLMAHNPKLRDIRYIVNLLCRIINNPGDHQDNHFRKKKTITVFKADSYHT